MEFLSTFNQSWETLGKEYLVNQNSRVTSPSPDSPVQLWIDESYLRSPEDALAVLAVIPIFANSRNYFRLERLREHIGQMAYNYRYEGRWKIVGEILSTTTSLSFREVWSQILVLFNENDWYGNFLKRMRIRMRKLRYVKVYSSVISDNRPVRKPQRKRGYDDKGTWRPIHKKIFSYCETGIDTRPKRVPTRIPHSIFWWGQREPET